MSKNQLHIALTANGVEEAKELLGKLEPLHDKNDIYVDLRIEQVLLEECVQEGKPEKVSIRVDVENLDETIAKAESLKPTLEGAKSLLNELASLIDALEVKVYD